MRRMPRLKIWITLLLPGLLAACGAKQPEVREGFPAPGELQLVSVAAADALDRRNLIPEETFEDWYAGAERPSSSAILLPLNTSKIERDMSGPAVGRVCIRQVWSAKDNVWRPDDFFGVEVPGLAPNSRYKLSLHAKTTEGSRAIVEVYGIREGDPLWHLQLKNWIQVEPGDGWREFEAEFDTGELTTVRLTTSFVGDFDPAKPNTVLWDDWKLKKVGASPAPEMKPNGILPNGGFTAWIPGKRAPEGFLPPDATLAHSEVFPMRLSDRDGDGQSVQQEWLASDAKDDPKTWFGTEVAVEPEKEYTFQLRGHDRGAPVVIGVYGVDGAGNLQVIADPLVAFDTIKDWQEHEARFSTKGHAKIRIVTHIAETSPDFPISAILDAWRLEPVG